jgi:adenylate kinase
MPEVIYLTGAPAAGKSSLTRRLAALHPQLQIFEFGQRLTDYVNRTRGSSIQQAELREKSSGIATPQDVRAVDDELISFVDQHRNLAPVIIDSHPVTKEAFGYRVTAYSLREFERLRPTQIWMLFTDPNIAVARIAASPEGRPSISVEEARFHTQLQAGVAATYGMHIGIPVYFFDADVEPDGLARLLLRRLLV